MGENLINNLNVDEIQAKAILDLKLQRLTNLDRENIEPEFKAINFEINKLQSIVTDNTLLLDEVKKDLNEILFNFSDERKSNIIYENTIQEVKEDFYIDEYSTYTILTHESYIKKLLKKSDNIKLKDTDSIIYQSYSSNKSTLLLFSNQGNCYKIYSHELQECKPSELGIYLPTLLTLSKEEKIVSMVSTRKYQGKIIEVFANGKIASVDLKSFYTESKRNVLRNAINTDSDLIKMFVIEEGKDVDILLKSSIDKVLITNTSVVSVKTTKSTQGNMVMRSKNDSTVAFAELLDNINIELIEDVEYYKGTTGVGSFLKKTDKIVLKLN